MAKPTRSFMADVGQASVGHAGPDYIEQDLDDVCAMFDPEKQLHTGQDGGIGPENCKDDWQVDQTQSASSNAGRPDTLLGRIANRIKAILGQADWKADPDTTLTTAKTHIDDTTKHSGIASIDGVSNVGGNVDLEAGTGIDIIPDNEAKKVRIVATGVSTPAPHAAEHMGGSDPMNAAGIGAETPAGAQAKVDTHEAEPSAHHPRYTNAEAVAAVKAADGHGSELDADTLDGLHAADITVGDAHTVDGAHAGTGPNEVLKLDGDGLVPLANVPGVLAGKDADTLDSKHAGAFLLVAGGSPSGTVNFDAVGTARIVLPVGTDQYAT